MPASCDSALVLAICSGVEMSPSSLVLHHEEGSRDDETLNVHPIAIIEETILLVVEASEWVVLRVKSFRHIVGMSCEGFEGELMVLLTAIEASKFQNGLASSSSPLSRSVNRR